MTQNLCINSTNAFNYMSIILIVMNVWMRTTISSESELKLIFVVHRHGDRTPIQSYPSDPFRNTSYWLDGWGQLTPRGKQRMYSFGQYLRQRYQHFLSDNPREVLIRSSASDRCLESVALVMAGLYRPEGRWQWDTNLGHKWQPFPIQTKPKHEDGMLNTGSNCTTAEQELDRIHKSPQVMAIVKQKKSVLDYVSSNTGLNITDLNGAEQVFDTLLIEKENNYELPRWVDDSTYHSLSQISDMTFYYDFATPLIQRLRTGLLLKDIIKHMNEAIKQNVSSTDPSVKLYVYSTHDTQIALLLNALNVFDKKSPPFGSAIMIELRQKETNNHTIEMFYLNDTVSQKPITLNLPNCTNTLNECLLNQFVNSVSALIPDDWDQECHNHPYSFTSNTVISYLFGSLLTLSIVTLVYITYTFLKPKNTEIVYQMLPIS